LHAYSFFSLTYGLARLVSMGQFEFPSGTKARRQKFAEDATRGFIRGLPLLEDGKLGRDANARGGRAGTALPSPSTPSARRSASAGRSSSAFSALVAFITR